MREEAVNAPEPEQNNAFGRSEPQAPDQASTSGRRRQRRDAETTLSRHATKCRICNHSDRHAIEFEFLNWRNPADLARSYKLRDLTTIYRHAHATSLFAKRRLNLRFAMERIVERVNEVPVTATSVIRAARAISRINDAGEWVDPPSRVIVTHIHAEDSSFVGASRGTGSQPVDSSVEVSSEDLQARAGTQGFVGRGFNRDKKRRSSKPSTRARQGGEGSVPSIPAHDSSRRISRPSLIFDDALLDEPSDSASAELPRIDGKPAPPEVILQLTPEFARCREERARALEADRQACAGSASRSGGSDPPASPQTEDVPLFSSSLPQAAFDQLAPASMAPSPARETRATIEGQSVASPSSLLPPAALEEPARSAERSASRSTDRESLVGRGFNRDIDDGSPSPSLLPQAAFPTSASSALPHHAAIENNVADVKQSVASPSSALAPARRGGETASDKPATAKQSPRAAGPPLGSSGSANPPFPFTPEPLRRWKPRRRF